MDVCMNLHNTVEPLSLGTASSVLINGGILISVVILYTYTVHVCILVAGTVHGVLIKGDVPFQGYPL